DGNDGGGTVAAKMGEFDGLKAHGDFLIYSWPEKAFWLSDLNPSNKQTLDCSSDVSTAVINSIFLSIFFCNSIGGTGILSCFTSVRLIPLTAAPFTKRCISCCILRFSKQAYRYKELQWEFVARRAVS